MEELNEKEIQALNEIFAKAARDPEFRNKLLNDSASVLKNYELSSETKKLLLDTVRGMQNH
ncbi:MAG TPA: hypothetical protein VI698_02300 [Nitrososphaerales archaeon]|nr:hypothetical protein [Nitrososphaerales archaeon]